MRKIVLFLLIAAMLVPLAACGGDSQKTPADTGASSGTAPDETEAEQSKTEAELVLEGLPERDFDGAELHIAYASTYQEFDRSKIKGEIFNDAVYERNDMLEKKYNIEITAESFAQADSIGGPGRQLETRLREDAMTGECDYQIIADTPYFVNDCAVDGIYRDLYTVPWLDFSASYWDHEAVKMFTIAKKLYIAMGALCIGNYGSSGVLFLNRDLATDLNLPDLYEMVWAGEWTIDRMTECSEAAMIDLNGDGAMDYDNDQWGTIFNHPQFYPVFPIALGFHYSQRTEDGSYDIVTGSEQNLHVLEACRDLVDSGVLGWDWENFLKLRPLGNCSGDYIFNEGRALFEFQSVSTELADIGFEYGILPVPKYDTAQENYTTSSHCYGATVVAVPRILSEEDVDKAGFMLEMMSALSEVTTFPTYVEKLLELKKSPDPDSTRVLRMIFANMTYDFVYSYYLTHFPRYVTSMVFEDKVGEFASFMKRYKIPLEVAIEDLEEAFSTNGT